MGDSKRKNVFVVGAGASAEFLLPTGKELLIEISRLARAKRDKLTRQIYYDTPELDDAILKVASNQNGHRAVTQADIERLQREAAWVSENAILAPSIDNMLHTHQAKPDLVSVGKLMIASTLISAEKTSTLYFDPRVTNFGSTIASITTRQDPRSGEVQQFSASWSWLSELFWLLAEGKTFNDFLEALKSISFVCFNYDRCIEFFLTNASASYFRLDQDQISTVYGALNVIKPYGTLGPLTVSGGAVKGFGEGDIFGASLGIRTFTEGTDLTDLPERLDAAFSEAEMVMFLGFGFIPLNTFLLFGEKQYRVTCVLGTGKGLSDQSRQIVSNNLIDQLMLKSQPGTPSPVHRATVLKKHKFDLVDETCAGLIRRHHVYLRTTTS